MVQKLSGSSQCAVYSAVVKYGHSSTTDGGAIDWIRSLDRNTVQDNALVVPLCCGKALLG